MFVRAKTIKGNKYAYLVENSWVDGKVKQVSKKYLGRIYDCGTVSSLSLDFSSTPSKQDALFFTLQEFFKAAGFVLQKNLLVKEDISLSLSSGKISKKNKQVVLLLNQRYIYSSLLSSFLQFNEPDDARPGQRLAQKISDLGIPLDPTSFIQLYKIVYNKV